MYLLHKCNFQNSLKQLRKLSWIILKYDMRQIYLELSWNTTWDKYIIINILKILSCFYINNFCEVLKLLIVISSNISLVIIISAFLKTLFQFCNSHMALVLLPLLFALSMSFYPWELNEWRSKLYEWLIYVIWII